MSLQGMAALAREVIELRQAFLDLAGDDGPALWAEICDVASRSPSGLTGWAEAGRRVLLRGEPLRPGHVADDIRESSLREIVGAGYAVMRMKGVRT